ncbi:type II toxin-antitoxin system RelE/ParE family toxin [Demequina sp. SYSU T00192]|uniref:Type II toxin-antitoxin system RelE/ParE family toxin n=1 Tax=Demequina litoralis TaxID=3051660 RepID=A0ABT8G942_9MICO|nr:type II toxin-antitoxin system RelE/ParE family toxin [Demequina sp. SYSU T00192]MDN4475204.1 type II toxin-antitoxin system RelE/ParE family toxin [Demequina sp. SYSU T00192]
MTIRLTELAVGDLTETRDHYRAIDEELERRFLGQLDRAMERLAMFPHGAPPVDGVPGVRRARIRDFPYGLFYRVDERGILVIRVLHTRRDTHDVG